MMAHTSESKYFLSRKLGQWLSSRYYLLLGLVIISLLLAIPSLWSGLVIDDFLQGITIQGWPPQLLPSELPPSFEKLTRPSLDIFTFLDGDPLKTKYFIKKGIIPWWTLERVKLRFWRPISALTHWLDYRLWPDSPLMMHWHSLVWLVMATSIVAIFYQKIIDIPWVAGLAALLYTIDDAHAIPVSWLANRNALIAIVFGVSSVILHDQWRKNHRCLTGLLAALSLGCGLLAKEETLAVCGYLLAYTLFLDQDHWFQRLMSLMPYSLVIVIWRIIYRLKGYGVSGLVWYIDPLISPVSFLKNIFIRATKLLYGQLALAKADSLGIIIMKPPGAAFLVICFLIIILYLWPDRLARFWFTGMLLALIPLCTSLPSERILFFIGLGAMGLLAQLFYRITTVQQGFFSFSQLQSKVIFWPMATLIYGFCFLLIAIHLIFAPLLWPLKIKGFKTWGGALNQSIETAPLAKTVADKTLVVVNATGFYPIYFSIVRLSKGQPVPQYIRNLASDFGYTVPIRLFRPDKYSLILEPQNGFPWTFFRDYAHALSVNTCFELPGLQAEVTKLAKEGWPKEVRYRFHLPLEDPSLIWLKIQNNASVPFSLPAIGETVVLEGDCETRM